MPDEDPAYKGDSMAIHVSDRTFSVVPAGPPNPEATYQGQTVPILSDNRSPAQWRDEEVTGVGFQNGYYVGRSPAIHVFGDEVQEFPPIDPIPSCDCEGGGGPLVCLHTDWSSMGAWEWIAGAGDGDFAGGGWGVVGNKFTLTVGADPNPGGAGNADWVQIELDEADDAALFAYLQGGDFTISGTFTIPAPYSGSPANSGGNTRYSTWTLAIRFVGDPTWGTYNITLTGEIGGATLSRVSLVAGGVQDDIVESFGQGSVAPGTYDFSIHFTPNETTASIAGYNLTCTHLSPFTPANLHALRIHQGEAPTSTTRAYDAGVYETSGLYIVRDDATAAAWCTGGVCWAPAPIDMYDTFDDRTVAPIGSDTAAWDPASGGGPWAVRIESGVEYSIDNNVGRIVEDHDNTGLEQGLAVGDLPYSGHSDFQMEVRYRWTNDPPSTGSHALKLRLRDDISPSGNQNCFSNTVAVNGLKDEWYRTRILWLYSTMTWYWKTWADVDSMPVTWDDTGTIGTFPLSDDPDSFWVEPSIVTSDTGIIAEFELDFVAFSTADGGAVNCEPTCPECEDPANPGFPLPDFEPGYMPIFRRQIGDPTTTLDSFICTFESAAMVLDWHTRGAVQVWGGELIPFSGRTEASIFDTGSNLGDAQTAWMRGWGQNLENWTGLTWAHLMNALNQGRAVVLQGDYDQFSGAESCQPGFVENHAISVYPYQISGRLLVGDPICHDFKGIAISSLQAYAEDLGAQVFGSQSPQPILFAVSRPWVP